MTKIVGNEFDIFVHSMYEKGMRRKKAPPFSFRNKQNSKSCQGYFVFLLFFEIFLLAWILSLK
jgi:hypothetical protein